MGADVPWAVAGLPDGGAAFTAAGTVEGGAQVFERQGSGASWQGLPFPGGSPPGSLALFREGGALRAVASGGEPGTASAESEAPPPPGFPPNIVVPYPLPIDPEHGVLRQTASGWSDEEHELNIAKEPPGEYLYYDSAYEPDPVASVLVDPSGGQGWAVGGLVDNSFPLLDTADVDRYPADGGTPVGDRFGAGCERTRAGDVRDRRRGAVRGAVRRSRGHVDRSRRVAVLGAGRGGTDRRSAGLLLHGRARDDRRHGGSRGARRPLRSRGAALRRTDRREPPADVCGAVLHRPRWRAQRG